MADKKDSKAVAQEQLVTFHYIKSPAFRSIHMDGGLGGVTPRGLIHCAFYNERPAIPKEQDMRVTEEGKLEMMEQRSRGGFVRELEFDTYFSAKTAVELRDWLTARLRELKKIKKAEKAAQDK